MTEMWIQRHNLRVNALQLRGFPSLRRIFVAKNVFGKLKGFALEDLPLLESLWIGSENDDSKRTRGGVFAVANCPRLSKILINCSNFCFFGVFSLKNLPSLDTLFIGAFCFHEVSRLCIASASDGAS